MDVNEPFEGTSALHIAIESRYIGREKMVALLLENGANPNGANNQGKTPANSLTEVEDFMKLLSERTAVKGANKEIADLLINHGAKTDPDFKSWFPDKKEE